MVNSLTKRGSHAALTIIFLLFGFMLAIQFRVRPSIDANVYHQRAEELSLLLEMTEQERDKLREEVQVLRDRVAEFMAGQSDIKALQEELVKARILAGLVEVKGPGVVVEMNDAQDSVGAGQDPNLFIIHDTDILAVVNELCAGGAEAISINGQRIVARTEIRCVGPVITVNGTRIAPPIKIQAIGDPNVLEPALKMRGGVVDNLKLWGIEVKIRVEEELILPAYSDSVSFKFAKPVEKEE